MKLFPLKSYIQHRRDELDKLATFKLPKPKTFTLDWKKLAACSGKNIKEMRKEIELYQYLEDKNKMPAIYLFNISPHDTKTVYSAFCKAKEVVNKIRIVNGLKHKDYYNISYVSKQFRDTDCLYVGSVKKGLTTRLKNHLGYNESKRTGALYLGRVLDGLHVNVEVKIFLLEKADENLTEHLERVMQFYKKPLLGKRINEL